MRRSTRGHPYHKSATERASELREQRLRDRTAMTMHLQHAEDNIHNVAFGIEYTPKMLQMMLMAYDNESAEIQALQRAHVRVLFACRQAWKLGTFFRNVWCTIAALQVAQLQMLGWTGQQIDAHNVKPGPPGLNVLALLVQVIAVFVGILCVYCFQRVQHSKNMFSHSIIQPMCVDSAWCCPSHFCVGVDF